MYIRDPVRLGLRHLYQVEFCSYIVRYPTAGALVYCDTFLVLFIYLFIYLFIFYFFLFIYFIFFFFIICEFFFFFFFVVCEFFLIFSFFKKSCRNTIRMSNSLDPNQPQPFVGPDLDPNCFSEVISRRQVATSGERVKVLLRFLIK